MCYEYSIEYVTIVMMNLPTTESEYIYSFTYNIKSLYIYTTKQNTIHKKQKVSTKTGLIAKWRSRPGNLQIRKIVKKTKVCRQCKSIYICITIYIHSNNYTTNLSVFTSQVVVTSYVRSIPRISPNAQKKKKISIHNYILNLPVPVIETGTAH